MIDKDEIITSAINFFFKINKKSDEEEKDYWDRFCAEKIASQKFSELDYFFQKKVYTRLCSCFLSILGSVKGKKILETGCGSGYLSMLLAQEGAKITLLDNSKLALKYSKNLLKQIESIQKVKYQVKYVAADVRRLPFNKNTFDIAHNCGVIEHYEDETILVILREMTRVVRKYGQIIVVVPNLLSPEIVCRMIKYGKGSERYLSKRKLKKLMQKAGLKKIEVKKANASVIPSCFPEKIHSRLAFLDDKLKFLDYLFYGRGFKV